MLAILWALPVAPERFRTAAAVLLALVLLVVLAVAGTIGQAADTANITAVVQAAQTLETGGRVVARLTFQVDHVSIVNDLYAIVEWIWGEGGGQDIFVNQGDATSPSWKYIGGGGGRIDAARLQRSCHVSPPYNVPLVSNVLNCAARNLQPIVPGMSSTGTACYQFVAPPTPTPTK